MDCWGEIERKRRKISKEGKYLVSGREGKRGNYSEKKKRRRWREDQMDKQTEFPLVYSTPFVAGVEEKLQSFDAS